MNINGASVLVTGGASGLGAATAQKLADEGAHVVILDLPSSNGNDVAERLNGTFVAADVTDPVGVETALDAAESQAPLRALVHCAGKGGAVRLVDRDGHPGSLEEYENVVRINLIGSFNVLRLTAARMAKNEDLNGERGVCILTGSIAAYEGQIGQIPYASAKAGIGGMTLVAARDLASKHIRVSTIAPGLFDTPILSRLPDKVRNALSRNIPHPNRFGMPEEYASLVQHIISNPMLNGETIRLDGAVRMAPR